MTTAHTFRAGDPPPRGYADWHEWSETQHKAGLRQRRCPRCHRYCFPQEFITADDDDSICRNHMEDEEEA